MIRIRNKSVSIIVLYNINSNIGAAISKQGELSCQIVKNI